MKKTNKQTRKKKKGKKRSQKMRAKEVYPVSSAKGRLRFPDFFLFKYDLDDRSRKFLTRLWLDISA